MRIKSHIQSILLLFGSIFFFIIYCTPCDNTEIKRITSPNGKLDFILFERNCGATTDFSLQGTILKNGTSLRSDAGNAIIMGSENYINPTYISVYPTWINDSKINLDCKNKPQIYHQYQVFGVTIATNHNPH